FGLFENPQLTWFKTPYPYGDWKFENGHWKQDSNKSGISRQQVAKQWRMYLHAPLAPCVEELSKFTADSVQADYRRAIQPGGRCRFTIRFWNLEQEELERLIWCLHLEQGLAHKTGKSKHLGFGSLRIKVLPESFLIDWAARYANKPEETWKQPLQVENFANIKAIKHYAELRKTLNAQFI
ncbi:MAG: hypothetical protein GY862_12125, partial [Gammaproteobacteria bacterium]|nr:hypothetical protein [Gammaproteobacteria bacterium]